jgi:virginiamycin B lyase
MLSRLKGLRLTLLAAAVAMLVVSVAQAAPIGMLKQFNVPTPNSSPKGITQSSDGNFWFTESHVNPPQGDNHHVGRITPGGTVTEFLVCQFCFPNAIAQAGDGNLYFTSNDGLGRISPTGEVLNPIGPPFPPTVIGNGITAGGNDVWFTDFNNDTLWRYNVVPPGTFTAFALPASAVTNRVPDGVAVDASGAVWIADFGANSLLRMTQGRKAPTFAEFLLPDGSPNGPREITIATDGKVWFTKRFDNSVGFLDPANGNAITIFPLAAGRGPEGIAAAPDGSVWFAQSVSGNIARITSAGVITESKVVKGSEPFGVTVAPTGDPWFTELSANKIAALLLR